MVGKLHELYKNKFHINENILHFCLQAEKGLQDAFFKIDTVAEFNQMKVLAAMQKNKLSDIHFAATTGYGYNDLGRDTLENIYADAFGGESALVRPQLISGTHAITTALSGNLRPGDEILSPVGIPYDTLQGIIGIRPERGSLAEYGITYKQVDLLPDFSFDYAAIEKAISKKTKLVTIQRSKGYEWRPALKISQIQELIRFVKYIKPNVICMVDNCYGEFVETEEPLAVGADLIVGSLIKNPGGGLAPTGGYIVGKEELVENAAFRLTAPGLGKEVGATLGITPSFLQGFFMAPQIVAGSVKTALFASSVFDALGFTVLPKPKDARGDIVQLIRMESADRVIAFCKGIQKAAPVDSFVVPEPWAMPGYDCPIIMAAGAFVQGSSIELSADAPIKPPYNVYFQGGLSWHHGKIGVMAGLAAMAEKGFVTLP